MIWSFIVVYEGVVSFSLLSLGFLFRCLAKLLAGALISDSFTWSDWIGNKYLLSKNACPHQTQASCSPLVCAASDFIINFIASFLISFRLAAATVHVTDAIVFSALFAVLAWLIKFDWYWHTIKRPTPFSASSRTWLISIHIFFALSLHYTNKTALCFLRDLLLMLKFTNILSSIGIWFLHRAI